MIVLGLGLERTSKDEDQTIDGLVSEIPASQIFKILVIVTLKVKETSLCFLKIGQEFLSISFEACRNRDEILVGWPSGTD